MTKRKWTREEVDAFRQEHQQIFYFNKEDSNLFVRKTYALGFTFNWANPLAWILLGTLLAAAIYRSITG